MDGAWPREEWPHGRLSLEVGDLDWGVDSTPETKLVKRLRRERASVGLSEDFSSSSSSQENSNEGDQSDRSSDHTDDSLMAALSSSRSTARRRLAVSSSRSPIEVSTPDSSPAPLRISRVDLFGEPSSDSDGSLSISSEPRNSCNDLLTVNKFSALPPTTVPRDKWIPGYRNRIPRSATETIPWSARRVSLTSISELDLNHFFHHFSKPAEFIFPASGKSRRPPASAWSAQLITFTQISQLYDRRPWAIYERRIDPISFQRDGWFQTLLAQYYDFEDRHRQALWEASHFLPISLLQRRSDPDLAAFAKERNRRRSRSGPKWKIVLRTILQGMIAGHCDLDILLDPIFLHFPRPKEAKTWYPGSSAGRADIPNLVTALSVDDEAGPWRNQFRSSISDHPGSSIPRLAGKYVSPE